MNYELCIDILVFNQIHTAGFAYAGLVGRAVAVGADVFFGEVNSLSGRGGLVGAGLFGAIVLVGAVFLVLALVGAFVGALGVGGCGGLLVGGCVVVGVAAAGRHYGCNSQHADYE